jgi:hypothetical protein
MATTQSLSLTGAGYAQSVPESVILAPVVLTAWARVGSAVRYCPPALLRSCTDKLKAVPDEVCAGHHDALVRPGQHIVVGRPGNPDHPRVVYLVKAVGTAGIRMIRIA